MSISSVAARVASHAIRPVKVARNVATGVASAVRRHPGGSACLAGGTGVITAPFVSSTVADWVYNPEMLEKIGVTLAAGNPALKCTTLLGLGFGLLHQSLRRFADAPLATVRDGFKSHALTTLQVGLGATLMAVAASAPMEQIAAVPGMVLLTHVLTKTGEMGRSLVKKVPKA